MRKIISLLLVIFFLTTSLHGAVKLPKLISDGMILQRDVKIKIWGWADANESVTIVFQNKTYQTTAISGRWSIWLPAMKFGGPYTMEISGTNKIILQDILIGDVWLCSGQSNMTLTFERLKDKYPAVITETNNKAIRNFFVPTTYNFHQPADDLPTGHWETATPENILRFGGIAFFFANALYEKYHIPIGLINASVGGSPVEAWLSEDALKKFPEQLSIAKKFSRDEYVDSIRSKDAATRKLWTLTLQQGDKGLNESQKWFAVDYDDTTWKTMRIPGFWDEQGLANVNGSVWFRKIIDVPASMVGKPARLFLGNIVDQDSVYVNGIFAGTTGYQYPPRKYSLTPQSLHAGRNLIAIRVINQTGRGGFYRGKPYKLFADGDTISLEGEWKYNVGKIMSPLPASTTFQYQPGGLYNGMIAPILNTSVKGIIWYQGESNTDKPHSYYNTFAAVINDWRAHWSDDKIPFLYVQLANFMATTEEPVESKWAELREAQRQTLSVPHTAMVVTIDIGEWNDIHPLNKKDVGERLSRAAEKIAYHNDKVIYSGPSLQSYSIRKNKVVLTFSNIGGGLTTNDGAPLKYFSIASSDHHFVWAHAEIKGNQIIVWSDQVQNPKIVRYAWADNPEGANLYNRDGLPASPFTTENQPPKK